MLHIKINFLNVDRYYATGANVADEYLNRMAASFYSVLKRNVK
jgi:hypothetical protein